MFVVNLSGFRDHSLLLRVPGSELKILGLGVKSLGLKV